MAGKDHKAESRRSFDRQAATYDTTGSGRHARRLHDDVMCAVGSFGFAGVLDVGCGTGATLAAIVAARPGAHAYGIDLSAEMLAVARERLGESADLRVADAEHLPLPDAAVDLVVCVDSFHHYPDPERALAEMRRVTRPGGGLVIGEWLVRAPWRQLMNALFKVVPAGDVRVYTQSQLTALATAAGYDVISCARAGVRGELLVGRLAAGD